MSAPAPEVPFTVPNFSMEALQRQMERVAYLSRTHVMFDVETPDGLVHLGIPLSTLKMHLQHPTIPGCSGAFRYEKKFILGNIRIDPEKNIAEGAFKPSMVME